MSSGDDRPEEGGEAMEEWLSPFSGPAGRRWSTGEGPETYLESPFTDEADEGEVGEQSESPRDARFWHEEPEPESEDEAKRAPAAGPLRVRILWPALGFPAVVAPRPPAQRGASGGDATRCITLLVLASRPLTKLDVVHALRVVPWAKRATRGGDGAAGTFSTAEVSIRVHAASDPILLPTPKNALVTFVGFGGGRGEKSGIVAGLSTAVRAFYERAGLRVLHEIRVSEAASHKLADGRYHLLWRNAAAGEKAPSDEMRLLLDEFARPRRQRLGEAFEKQEKFLLDEYEWDYGMLHQPYQKKHEIAMRDRGARAEILHPLFVRRDAAEPLRIGQLSDTHVDVRADVYEANLEAARSTPPRPDLVAMFDKGWAIVAKQLLPKRRAPKPWRRPEDLRALAEASKLPAEQVLHIAAHKFLWRHWRTGSYNNLNRSFVANYQKAKEEADIVLITGDLIEYGRGHWGVTARGLLGQDHAYHEDRNWFLFQYLLAAGESYTKPTYTILGNHDWRLNPFPPFAVAGAPSPAAILNNYEDFVDEYRRWVLQIAHGPGYERGFSYASSAKDEAELFSKEPAEALATIGKLAINTRRLSIPRSPTETSIESVIWYLLAINPFLDYAFSLPTGHQLLMLDWAKDEDVLLDIVEKGKARPYLPHEAKQASDAGPMAGECLTAAQRKLVTGFVARPGTAKIVGIHAPPISPYPDWYDDELAKGWKTFGEKDPRRGPDVVAVQADGRKVRKNGHPMLAVRPKGGFHGIEADYNSFVRWRSEFISALLPPSSGVRLVLAGHVHRDAMLALRRIGKEHGAQMQGALLVRGIPGPLQRLVPGSIVGPLWVNVTSAGYRGNYKPAYGKGRVQAPGRALIAISRNGTIERAEFRHLPETGRATPDLPPKVTTPVVPRTVGAGGR